MSQFLRQSTSQVIRFGPFVDSTDGVTAETALTIAQADMQLSKDGGAFAQKNAAGNATHDTDGWYSTTLDATDTNTVGVLKLQAVVAGALHVWETFYVVEESIYDSLFASGATGFDANQRVNVGSWLSQPVTLSTGNLPDVNIAEISDDATAADNLESMYDGTGYTAETAPSSRSQVASIGASSGGAINFSAETDNTLAAIKTISFVGAQTGTFANTDADDGTYHVIDDTLDAIDIVYQFDVGGSRTANEVIFKGYLSGSNDTITIQAYDYEGDVWDTRFSLDGQAGVTDVSLNITLLSKHTGTAGADLGKTLIRFVTTGQSDPQLNIDELIVSAVSTSTNLGFVGGAVWIDTNNGVAGTGEGVGTVTLPSSNITDARTIADNNNLKVFHVLPASSITLAQSFESFEFIGFAYTVNLGSQSVTGSLFKDALITGSDSGTNTTLPTVYNHCVIDDATSFGRSIFLNCGFSGVTTFVEAGLSDIYQSSSRIAGNGGAPTYIFGTNGVELYFSDYSGGIELSSMQGGVTPDACSIQGDGNVIINADCTGGNLAIRGNFTLTDNSGGALTLTDDARFATDQLDSADISVATANKIADHTLRRTLANARASSNGDTVTFRSPLGAVSKLANRVGISGTNLLTYQEDDVTVFGTQAVTTSASADPITEVDTV